MIVQNSAVALIEARLAVLHGGSDSLGELERRLIQQRADLAAAEGVFAAAVQEVAELEQARDLLVAEQLGSEVSG